MIFRWNSLSSVSPEGLVSPYRFRQNQCIRYPACQRPYRDTISLHTSTPSHGVRGQSEAAMRDCLKIELLFIRAHKRLLLWKNITKTGSISFLQLLGDIARVILKRWIGVPVHIHYLVKIIPSKPGGFKLENGLYSGSCWLSLIKRGNGQIAHEGGAPHRHSQIESSNPHCRVLCPA